MVLQGQDAFESRPEQPRRRGRGRTKPYPMFKFEEVLPLAQGLIEHGVGGNMSRLTLLNILELRPSSSKTRNLITNSGKYGLTVGGHSGTDMEITKDAEIVLKQDTSDWESRQKAFDLAIQQFDTLNTVYERMKGGHLRDESVIIDELKRAGAAESDSQKLAEVFDANLRYIGLIQPISGSEHVISMEEFLRQLPTASSDPSKEAGETETDPVRVDPPLQSDDKYKLPGHSPALHIDIQIHIDSTASAEQIDLIFASMARHLYKRE